jgi:DNA mismatch endonuclease, patch repair protein
VVPKANSSYWQPKLARNAERDRETVQRLEAGDWSVLRIWEHEEPDAVAARIVSQVKARSVLFLL